MIQQFSFGDFLTVYQSLGLSVVAFISLFFLALTLSAFVKIATVLGMLRAGLGMYGLPSAFVTGGLAFALSFFVMFPLIQTSTGAIDTVLKQGNSSPAVQAEALDAGVAVWKEFVIKHTAKDELTKFVKVAAQGAEVDVNTQSASPSWRILAPAFLVSELKSAFITGLGIFLPFLVVDLLIATILTAVGMTQTNPELVAFPFKLVLFVMLDGWAMITTNLISTYMR